MKQGHNLQEIAKELTRQLKTKKDYVAPTREVEMIINNTFPEMRVNGYGTFDITETAHGQIAQRLGIPQRYYDKMRGDNEGTSLLRENVNHWLSREKDPKLIRTMDGKMRAFLSHRYRPLDNFDLAEVTLPIIRDMGCRVESAALTDNRLYIKAITERVTAEVKPGDVVQAGIVISNSEIGLGSVKVEPLIFRLVCTNGMIASDHSLSKYHVGRNVEVDLAEEFFRDETRKADDRAFWMKVSDVVRGAITEDGFQRIVNSMRAATARPIEADVVEVVDSVKEKFALAETEKSGVLTHLINGGDLSQYGLMNAITRTSQDVKDYDRATELERLGGQVLALTDSAWKELAA